jgi:hypothetical protein
MKYQFQNTEMFEMNKQGQLIEVWMKLNNKTSMGTFLHP